ncbi:hypothetical protein METBIDRAFT_33480 [Metschnikowia bicuspidata var. bicuspidata NRRL YB-4993]|uniref:P/Homo B domain-containing protein n=1 Tax=Metschnikowia bicuspidata var. bicuspidata NRRL YB-4993 TaxID=869754 RepID=A0A1A0H5Q8_9ASCO|nr:hypothetical protein METBIDRAFT_33480 [Metschnikowia bicuspidata var. bicuspidata NRRL YB-4993]OBA19290.1 hypothetical protein METBIDRAFT_33480 [Metschnikowia bicuspidata var. bicuspidata NRRL YB-4993]
MRLSVVLLLAVAHVLGLNIPEKNYSERQYFVVEIDTLASLSPLQTFITRFNDWVRFEHPARGLDDHFVFSSSKTHDYTESLGNYNSNEYDLIKRSNGFEDEYDELTSFPNLKLIHMLHPKTLEKRLPVFLDQPVERKPENSYHLRNTRRLDIIDSSQEPAKEVSDKLGIEDPLFLQQWHLINTNYPGHDVNVKKVWYDGIRGKGITVAIVDDGLDYESPDLLENFSKEGLWDFNDNGALPKPRLFDDYHGTRCAGEVAAVKNDVCGLGVAYESKVAGIRILSGSITSEDEAAAMIYGLEHNDIYSCSWGPTDNGRTVSAPESLVKKAMIKGIQEGRANKGAIYVFASGNGGRVGDQCNFDGYTNSIYSITVGAIDHKGLHPPYAEACSAVMVVTYSSGSGEHIHTTDIHEKCSAQHGGTSAAAPLAAGIYALVLQANPELTWRDTQYLSATAAVPINEHDGDYQMTAFGQKYSNKYGFGKLDAEVLIEQAKAWKNVKPQAWHYSDLQTVNQKLKPKRGEESSIISSIITVTKENLQVMNFEQVEHVTVKVNIGSQTRGLLDVKLVSPFGVVSQLTKKREYDTAKKGLENWTFMSVAHWGETGLGDWKLEVSTTLGNEIIVKNWQLNFFGACVDPEKAEKYDLDQDYAKIRRKRESAAEEKPPIIQSSATSQSTSISSTSASKSSQPSKETSLSHGGSLVSTGTSMSTALPSEDNVEEPDEPEGQDHTGKFLSSEHMGQYFMLLAVLGFIFVLVMMKWHRNQSSTRRRRRDFEFDIIPGEDYSDSDDDGEAFELQTPSQEDLERERLFDDFNVESLPDYDDDAFQVGDEDDFDKSHEERTGDVAEGHSVEISAVGETENENENQGT